MGLKERRDAIISRRELNELRIIQSVPRHLEFSLVEDPLLEDFIERLDRPTRWMPHVKSSPYLLGSDPETARGILWEKHVQSVAKDMAASDPRLQADLLTDRTCLMQSNRNFIRDARGRIVCRDGSGNELIEYDDVLALQSNVAEGENGGHYNGTPVYVTAKTSFGQRNDYITKGLNARYINHVSSPLTELFQTSSLGMVVAICGSYSSATLDGLEYAGAYVYNRDTHKSNLRRATKAAVSGEW